MLLARDATRFEADVGREVLAAVSETVGGGVFLGVHGFGEVFDHETGSAQRTKQSWFGESVLLLRHTCSSYQVDGQYGLPSVFLPDLFPSLILSSACSSRGLAKVSPSFE